MHNHRFWKRSFQETFVPHLRRLQRTLDERLLPTFEKLDVEAEELQEVAFDRFNHMPAGPDCDPSWPAEMAHEEALDFYLGMTAVRQSLLNAFAPILYHAWEQQLLSFHRREILHPAEQHDPRLLSLKVLASRLLTSGLDLESLPSWKTITELKHVANTVKHADGPSAAIVKTQYPKLFENPFLDDSSLPKLKFTPRVYSPLSGEDLYLRQADLHRYCDALITFWSELPDALADA